MKRPCTRPRGMAQDDDGHVQPHPAISPFFLSLPDIAHASIASFLPDGNKGNDSRLRVSEVSRAMLESYGGTVTRMNLRHVEDSSAAALIALLRRQKRVAEVTVENERKIIPAFCQAIVQDCCRRVEAVHLRIWYPALTQEESDLLAQALEKDGALRALKIHCSLAHGGYSKFARALARGTAPQLQDLSFSFLGNTDDMDAVADMLEARARIPGR